MTLRKILLASTALGAAAVLAGPAFAGSAAATQNEIDTLKMQMEMLQQKLNDLQIQTASDIKGLKGGDATVSLKGGKFSVKSNDGQYEFKLTGRAHFDVATADTDSTLAKYNAGANFRRAEIGASGFFMKDWHYGIAYQFGGSGTDSTGSLKEAFLSYEGFENLALQIGAISLPLTLDYATSSNDITFIERPAAVNMMIGLGSDDGRSAVGATYANNGLFAMAYYTKDRPGNLDPKNSAESDNAVGRLAYAFNLGGESVLHVGASGTHAFHVQGKSGVPASLSLADRPGIRVNDIKYFGATVTNVDSASYYGPELAFASGPFRAQGEYYKYDIKTKLGGGDYSFSSYYVQASYILTGESYKYKDSAAAFKGVSPDNPVGKGGFGAWEIAARYGNSDMNDRSIVGGEEKLTTVGLNWYPNSSVRFMANYIHADEQPTAVTSGNVDIIALRTQFAF